MAKNKYVYGMADAAVIVHSGTTGGTWSGALEILKTGSLFDTVTALAKNAEQLLKELVISKTQLQAWLKRAAEEGKLRKTKAPVRYKWLSSEPNPKQAAIS